MLTIFSTPKPFRGHSGIIQRNALQSWKRLRPDVEVILFGDEEGAAEVCAELGLRHEPRVERSPGGPKYLSYLFQRAQEIARHDFLCYSNCDIVLMSDFGKAFQAAAAWRRQFLMVGQRWDAEVTQSLEFDRADWEEQLRRLALSRGAQQYIDMIDYFVFHKGLYRDMPPLVVGRIYWDHWLIWKARSSKLPVVDCSSAVVAVHQNHDYGYHPGGRQGTFRDEEAMRNYKLAGNGEHLRTIEDATHKVTPSGRVRRTPWRRQLAGPKRFLWKIFVQKTFPLRKRLGIRREKLQKIFHRDSESRD